MIDELPILAVAGALANGTTIIRHAQELRVKETDRIAAIAHNLRSMGAQVVELRDGLEIHGRAPLHGARLSSFGDHRIAMAFAVAGMFAEGETVIQDVDCVATSYPGFEKTLTNSSIRKPFAPPRRSSVRSRTLARRKISRGAASLAMNSTAAHKIIAIDGPAASGKSSVARELARRLGFVYVNSGAMYRAMTWLVLERGIPPADAAAIEQLAERAAISCELRDHDSLILIDGVDPEPFLREDRVNENVSLVSSVPRLREILVDHLRRYARSERSCHGRPRHRLGRFSRDAFQVLHRCFAGYSSAPARSAGTTRPHHRAR